MRTALAEKLLVKIMDWTIDEVSNERPLLQSLANFKYNEYQQFSPGIRFVESLVLWLKQFETLDERKIAYRFFLNELVFISNSEIFHLLSVAYPDIINPLLIKKTAKKASLSQYQIKKIINHTEYKNAVKQSLYIGLSDGSRIDQFRRVCGINNEQVSPTYQINGDKAADMLNELNKEESIKIKFNSIFLIDDFTASGISYFRPQEKKGKIFKFLNAIFEEESATENQLKSLVNTEDLEIHILFYIATQEAISLLKSCIEEWKKSSGINIEISVNCIQLLKEDLKNSVSSNKGFKELIEKYFDDSIVDKHYKMGKYSNPFLGFNECSLPLVLSHNTPNNSLPILWLPEDKKFRGLFPRVSRHR